MGICLPRKSTEYSVALYFRDFWVVESDTDRDPECVLFFF